jgi:hypothetical protein
MGIEAICEKIIGETDALRAQYQANYVGDPDAELLAWLQIAVQREAMVCYLYDQTTRDKRLADAEGDVVEVARDALTLIWQQEKSHAAELAARLIDGVFTDRKGAFDAAFLKIRGTLDAGMLDVLTNEKGGPLSALAKAATWIASKFAPKMVPPFAIELPRATLRDFFVLACALEQTAKDSYARIGEILPALVVKSSSLQPHGLLKPILDTRLDELFHERVFREMASWMNADGRFATDLDAKACMQKLRQILVDTTGIQKYRGGPIPIVSSDGGLGKLFAKHSIPIEVEEVAGQTPHRETAA